jgi:hypothetical protein
MKRCFLLFLAAIGVITTLMAQTQASSGPEKVTDPDILKRLQTDLNFRNSELRNSQAYDQQVDWVDNGNGYSGYYNLNGDDWMICYDKDVEYMETFRKDNWNDSRLPATLRKAYSQSLFKDNKVTSFWIVADTERKGYFLETVDKNGKTMSVWVDQNGEFITMPPKNPNKKVASDNK